MAKSNVSASATGVELLPGLNDQFAIPDAVDLDRQINTRPLQPAIAGNDPCVLHKEGMWTQAVAMAIAIVVVVVDFVPLAGW